MNASPTTYGTARGSVVLHTITNGQAVCRPTMATVATFTGQAAQDRLTDGGRLCKQCDAATARILGDVAGTEADAQELSTVDTDDAPTVPTTRDDTLRADEPTTRLQADRASARKGARMVRLQASEDAPILARHTAWSVVTERVTVPMWLGYVWNLSYSSALEARIRPGDAAARVSLSHGDIVNDVAERAILDIIAMVGATDGINVVADTYTRDDATSYVVTEVNGTATRTYGWWVAYRTRCGACARCTGRRGGCTEPLITHEYVSLSRIVGRALWTIVRTTFRADAAYAHTMTDAQWATVGDTVAAPVTAHDAHADTYGAMAHDVARKAIETCRSEGVPFMVAGGVSDRAREIIAQQSGYSASRQGFRSAQNFLKGVR